MVTTHGEEYRGVVCPRGACVSQLCGRSGSEQFQNLRLREVRDVIANLADGIEQLEQGADFLGMAALFKNEPVVDTAVVAVVDDPGGNGRALRRFEGLAGVERESEQVTVARVSLSKPRAQGGEGAKLIAAPEQQLGRVHRTRTQEYVAGFEFANLATRGVIQVRHLVAARGGGFDAGYLALRADVGSEVTSNLQIVEVQRVLRMNVASDIAFAAVDAAALLGLEFVEMRGFRPKVDRDIRVAELVEAMKLIRDFSH